MKRRKLIKHALEDIEQAAKYVLERVGKIKERLKKRKQRTA